jgi:hypothetical protein
MIKIIPKDNGGYSVYDSDGVSFEFVNYQELSSFIRENNMMDVDSSIIDWCDEYKKATGK